MGVELRIFLLPADNTFRPNADEMRRLIHALRERNFIPDAGEARRTKITLRTKHEWQEFAGDVTTKIQEPEFILQYKVEDRLQACLAPPHTSVEDVEKEMENEEGAYYDIELHFSDDYVSVDSEMVDPVPTECECGEELCYAPELGTDIFRAERVRRYCPDCGVEFRPQDWAVAARDAETFKQYDLNGGLTYRFAVIIDCGKCWYTRPGKASALTPEFIETCTSALGVPMREIISMY